MYFLGIIIPILKRGKEKSILYKSIPFSTSHVIFWNGIFLLHWADFPLQITWFVGNAMSVKGTLFTTNWTVLTHSSHRASGSTVWRRDQLVCSLSLHSNQGLVKSTQFSLVSFLLSMIIENMSVFDKRPSRFASSASKVSIQGHPRLIYVTQSTPVEIVQTWMRGARLPEPCARTLRDPSTPWRPLTRHSANSWTSARKPSWTKR